MRVTKVKKFILEFCWQKRIFQDPHIIKWSTRNAVFLLQADYEFLEFLCTPVCHHGIKFTLTAIIVEGH